MLDGGEGGRGNSHDEYLFLPANVASLGESFSLWIVGVGGALWRVV